MEIKTHGILLILLPLLGSTCTGEDANFMYKYLWVNPIRLVSVSHVADPHSFPKPARESHIRMQTKRSMRRCLAFESAQNLSHVAL